jgi:hypothetical protein
MVLGIFRGHLIIYSTLLLAFIVGWLSHSVYLDWAAPEEENILIPGESSFLAKVSNALTFSSAEIMSPQDHVSEEQIRVYEDRVVLLIDNLLWSSFTNTNSMDPLLDIGANGIEIIPESEEDIHVGDVISYKNEKGDIVIHRVIEMNADNDGIYYVVKGDNNPIADSTKVRFVDVQGILVAVVY